MTDEPIEEPGTRQPPADLIAELSVIGASLLSTVALDDVSEILTPEDFYRPGNEVVFSALLALRKRGEAVDPTTAVAELQHRGVLAKVGGAPYVHDCIAGVPTTANAGYYARIVAKLATRRRLIAAGTRVVQMGYATDGAEIDETIEQARSEVDACSRSIAELHLIGNDLAETISRLSEPDDSTPTRWSALNHMIGGLRPGGFYVVGARPGVGKSLMANGLVRSLAESGGVAYNNLEMSRHEVYERMLSAESSISYRSFVNRTLTDADYRRLVDPAVRLEALPISVDDRPTVSVTDIRSHARSMARRGPLAGVVVDYLQLMGGGVRNDRRLRHEIVGEISRSLKILAKELQVPVIALSQLNRGSAQRSDPHPTLADLRESGSLEQDADVVLLLHMDEEHPEDLEVAVGKNRQGSTGMFRLARLGHYARLDDIPWSPTNAAG